MDVSGLLLKLLQTALSSSSLPGWVQEMIIHQVSQCLTAEAIGKLADHLKAWLVTELKQLEGPTPNAGAKLIYDAIIAALGGDPAPLRALQLAEAAPA